MDPAVNFILTLFDILLVVSLLWLAWRLLVSEDIFKGVVLFISFGLLMALAWVRLNAPDLALAEAAIGAGLSGPLFLAALRRLERLQNQERRVNFEEHRDADRLPETRTRQMTGKVIPALIIILITGLTAFLAKIFLFLPANPGLGGTVAANLKASGVQSPVTAVLLNFRGYDTLLEVMVLLLAIISVWSMNRSAANVGQTVTSPVQMTLTRLLVPLMVLIAFHLVWQGSRFAGGAFQGGAVLAGAGILLFISGLPPKRSVPPSLIRCGLVFGPLVFLAVALLCLAMGNNLLAYPPALAGTILVIIETACAVSIGLTLAGLFAGGRPENEYGSDQPTIPSPQGSEEGRK